MFFVKHFTANQIECKVINQKKPSYFALEVANNAAYDSAHKGFPKSVASI